MASRNATMKKGQVRRCDVKQGHKEFDGYLIEGKVGVYKDPDTKRWTCVHLSSGLTFGSLRLQKHAKEVAVEVALGMPDIFWVPLTKEHAPMIRACRSLVNNYIASKVEAEDR